MPRRIALGELVLRQWDTDGEARDLLVAGEDIGEVVTVDRELRPDGSWAAPPGRVAVVHRSGGSVPLLVGRSHQTCNGRASSISPDDHPGTMDAAVFVPHPRADTILRHEVNDLGSGANVDPGRRRSPREDGVEGRPAHRKAVADRPGLLGRPLLEGAPVQGEVLARQRRCACCEHIVEHADLVQGPDQSVTTKEVSRESVGGEVPRLQQAHGHPADRQSHRRQAASDATSDDDHVHLVRHSDHGRVRPVLPWSEPRVRRALRTSSRYRARRVL